MTENKYTKKVISKTYFKHFYKLLVITYSFYISFSAQAFSMTAEAPLGASFKQIVVAETTNERESMDAETAERIQKIYDYFDRYNLPLKHEAEHFVAAADRYDIDWRLVAAIGFIESTGGKFACQTARYSAFGWGSCKINFDSYEESIDVISMNLGGYNPNTARYYRGKSLRGILEAYNPPHIVPNYADKVMRQMDIIDKQ